MEQQIYYQMSTTNKGFLNVAKELKARGKKNYRFMLALKDRDLTGVDPSDPNLDTYMKAKVVQECRNNIWYLS